MCPQHSGFYSLHLGYHEPPPVLHTTMLRVHPTPGKGSAETRASEDLHAPPVFFEVSAGMAGAESGPRICACSPCTSSQSHGSYQKTFCCCYYQACLKCQNDIGFLNHKAYFPGFFPLLFSVNIVKYSSSEKLKTEKL